MGDEQQGEAGSECGEELGGGVEKKVVGAAVEGKGGDGLGVDVAEEIENEDDLMRCQEEKAGIER